MGGDQVAKEIVIQPFPGLGLRNHANLKGRAKDLRNL
jgi:hypothetical protein